MAQDADCSCFVVTTERGDHVPIQWVCLHPAVRMRRKDGTTFEGWSMGPTLWSTPSGDEVLMEIEMDDGEVVIFSPDEIDTLTPVGGYDDLAKFRRAVDAMLLQRPSTPDSEDVDLTLVLDAHTTILVTIQKNTDRCISA